MRVTVKPTDRIVEINGGLKARVWEGTAETGIGVQMIVPRIVALATEDLSQFERELEEMPTPSAALPHAFPSRMIL